MKKLQHILKFAVTFVLVTVFVISTNAANITTLPATGVWNGGTLANDVAVTLTGDVDLKGPIIIPSGKKLTIRKKAGTNSSDTKLTYDRLYLSESFTVPAGQIPCMFEVQEGGTLEIIGNNVDADDYIAIKGSTGLELPSPMTDGVFNQSAVNEYYKDANYKNVGRYYPDPTKTSFLYDFGKKNGAIDSGAMLYVVGTLVMKHAKIASGFSTVQGAAIKRPTVSLSQYNNAIFGTMTLDHVHIRNCYSDSGSAIIIFNQAQDNFGGGNTPTGCSTTLSDCKIYRNYSRCTEGVGGTIRTGGGVVGNLTMTNTTVYENYAGTYGRGMVTAAQGHENTVFVMDGCKIHDNRAATYAGAALISGSFQFKNNVTKIYNNKAGTYGGGLYLITYNGVKFTTPKTLNMNFSDKLELYGNTAGTSAGAICLNMRELTSLVEGSEININFEGVNIHDNTAAQDGGAVMMTYDNSKVNVNLNINSCTINNNKATAGNGGGIYCQIGPISGDDPSPSVDVTKCKVNLNGGTISNNHADAACGGGVYVKNLPIYCDQNASGVKVHGNTSLNKGGGLYITGSEFTMYSGQIYGNSCTSATCEGGGIYADGAELNITGGVIGGNSAAYANRSHNGAGIFLFNSDLVMNQGQVSYNESNNNAGGIYVKNASNFTFNNGSISNNTCEVHGGGLYVSGCLSFNITNGVISGNTTKNTKGATSSNGGAMFLASDAKNVNISGGEISNNTSAVRGGAIASATGFTISAGRIIGNTSNQGGGIYFSLSEVATTNSVVLSGGEVSGNKSTDIGGGIYVANGNLTIDGAEIRNNTSGSNGGGINFNSDGGDFDMKGGSISNNTAVWHGGAVYVENARSFSIEDGTINSNTAGKQAGAICFASASSGLEVVISGGEISHNQSTEEYGGAVYGAGANITVKGGIISNNTAEKDLGGAFYVSKGNLTIEDGKIFKNKTGKNGGAINYNVDGGLLTIMGGEIYENTSTGYGGGIHVADGALTIEKGNIHDNTSGNHGGGVYFHVAGSTLIMNGGVISGNEVTNGHGGGIYCSEGNLRITDGEGESPCIQHNVAADKGGGICYDVSGGTMTVEGGKIVGNVANVNGGGIYLTQGTLNISDGEISSNEAKRNGANSGYGGGIYADDVKAIVNISGDSRILNNIAYSGAGMHAQKAVVSMVGGEIRGNEAATVGGGIYNYQAKITMTGGNIIGNKASRGGGIALGNAAASMTFGNGHITNNRAVYTSGSLTTGASAQGGQGFGGGICIFSGTFIFEDATSVGLYNNIADKAGDDLFANGVNTTVTLPYVGSMDLSGYKTETSELYWVEDYMNGDTGYALGTYMNKAQGYVPIRYREAIANQNLVYPVPVSEGGQTFTDKYMALSLGHEIIYATLVRSGLLKGENAIYRVSRLDDKGTADKTDDRWIVYSELLLFGPEDALTAELAANKSVSKRIALYSGTWKVEEIGWAWSYDHSSGAITHTIGSGSSVQEKSFIFMGSKLASEAEGYVSPAHYGESVVTNDFGSGTADTDKGAPASSTSFETITPEGGVSW